MISNLQTILFLGNGRCYHTLDWFRSAQELNPQNPPVLITDLIESESFEKLIKISDVVAYLFVLDRYLLKTQSRLGNIWRNALKLIVLPMQIFKLKRIIEKYNNPIINAHSMYYVMVARFAGCPYVATPQGSEVLVRPYLSRAYKLFSRIAMSKALSIVVDSVSMQQTLRSLYKFDSKLVQNGIDIEAIHSAININESRNKLVSIRAIEPNYNIVNILTERNNLAPNLPIYFCYPFIEIEYKARLKNMFIEKDYDLGRLSRAELYQLLLSSKLVISIPESDSSPRSVYEAIFCGCIVAVLDNMWIAQLPSCMRARLFIVDLQSKNWFLDAIKYADSNAGTPYIPSSDALAMFDQKQSMKRLLDEVFLS